MLLEVYVERHGLKYIKLKLQKKANYECRRT